jgi:hypothetical protein
VNEVLKADPTEVKNISKSLRSIASWIEDINTPLDKQAEEAINTLLRTYSKRSQIAVIAMAHYNLKKIVDWLELSEKAEKKLAAQVEEHGDQMTSEELRRTIELYHRRITSAFEVINELGKQADGLPKSVEDDDEKAKRQEAATSSVPVFDTAGKREKARKLVQLLEMMSNEDDEADVIDIESTPTE